MTRFAKGQEVEVNAKGSLYDRLTGQVVDVDEQGVVEVAFDYPYGPLGDSTNIFMAAELAPRGQGRRLSWWERVSRLWGWI
jgi:hypothetical protein